MAPLNIFQRILKIGEAEAHDILNHLEDPIKLTEQGIRDLHADLDQSLRALAEVKATSIRARNRAEECESRARDYENKAVQLLQRAHKGDLNPKDADRLAGEALLKKEENHELATQALQEKAGHDQSVSELDQGVKTLRATISKWENELRILKARATVSKATQTINKQLARIDSADTVNLLERMKEKIAVEEALAESYGDLAQQHPTVDEEIDRALQSSAARKAAEDVAALKAKLGLPAQPPENPGEKFQ